MGPFALLSAIIIFSGINAENIICQVSVSPVPEGGSASISCVFPFDLVEHNASFLIRHDDLITGQHHTVADCKWDSVGQNHSCEYFYQKSKYEIVWINHEVKLIIPRASRLQTGNYSCELHTKENRPAYISLPCTLNVTETPFVTSCTVSLVKQGHGAAVICHFNKNLHDLQVDVDVLRQPLSALRNNEESLVMHCTWTDNTPKCWQKKGYSVNKTIASTLTLEIPQENQGRYICRAHSSLEGQEERCEFKMLDAQHDTGQIWTTYYFWVIIGLLVVVIVLGVGFIVVRKLLPRCPPQAKKPNQAVQLLPLVSTTSQATQSGGSATPFDDTHDDNDNDQHDNTSSHTTSNDSM